MIYYLLEYHNSKSTIVNTWIPFLLLEEPRSSPASRFSRIKCG